MCHHAEEHLDQNRDQNQDLNQGEQPCGTHVDELYAGSGAGPDDVASL